MSIGSGPSRPEEVPALKALWRQAFGDDDAFIDAFFKTVFRPENALVLREDGQLRAMAFWLPMTVCWERKGWPAAYLYAVATDPAARGRGFCSRLLDFAAEFLASRGCRVLLLVPGEESLRRFYGARGYADCSAIDTLELAAQPIDGLAEPVAPPVYLELREALLAQRAYVSCPVPVLAFQEAAARLEGGGLYRLTRNGLEGCACAAPGKDGRAVICDLLWPGDPADAAALVMQALRAPRARVRLPGASTPFAMSRWLVPPPELPPVYFGLALD